MHFCISFLNYGSGPCNWWSAASPIASSTEFPGCGVVPISDPFGRSGICGRSSVSPAHLNVQQPPRRSEFYSYVIFIVVYNNNNLHVHVLPAIICM